MKSPLKILYLEDEANLEEVVKLYLEKEGIEADLQRVATRKDFESSLSMLEYDLFILDRVLDDIDGLEAITLIRKTNPNVPIIMLSGTLDEQLIVKALKSGANDYVLKQNIERLGSTIKNALQQSNKTENNYPSLNTEDRFQDIANNLPGGIYQFKRNKDGSYCLPCISTQFQKLMGVSNNDVSKDATLAFEKVHPDDLVEMMDSIEESATSLNKWEFEFRIKKENGDYFWTKGISTPRLQKDGSIIWAGILLDVDAQKNTENALRKSESKLRAILDNMLETFYRTDLQGRLIMVSPSVYDLIGFKPDELLGKKLSDYYFEPEGREHFLKNLAENNGAVSNYEAPLKHKQGHAVWVSTCASYYKDEHGEVAGVEGTTRNITKRHAAEVALQQSHAELERQVQQRTKELEKNHAYINSVLENIVDGIITIDVKGTIKTINPAVTNIFGYKESELVGHNIKILMPEPFHSEHDGYLENYTQGGEANVLGIGREVSGKRKNGEIFPLDLSVAEIQYDGKRYFTGLVKDITERVNIENALKINQDRYERSQTYANIGTWDWNVQTGDLYWSERIAPLFGYQKGTLETTYDNFLGSVHPDDRQDVIDAVNNCIEKGLEYNIEHRCVWPDGTERWLLEKGDVTRATDGTPLHMLGVVQDITERKQAEQALYESQGKLSGLFNLSPLGIALTDMQGKYIEFNDAFKEICGYPADELKTLDYWTLTPREYESEEQQQVESLKSTGRYGPYEKVYRQKNGNLVPIRLNGMLIEDKNGNQAIWSIVEDITENKQAEQALITAKTEAEHANKAKSEFLSSMSHELRTPLNAILGFSQLLEMDKTLNSEQHENIAEIHKAGGHLLDLINEILDLSKIEAGHIELNIGEVNLRDTIEECLLLIKNTANKHGIALESNTTDSLSGCFVLADSKRLKQVILNLLSNAIKYNKANGKVFITCNKTVTNRINVSVRDTGKGIAKDKLADLFLPFNRLGAENSNIEGTGIGLVITKMLIEQMGGDLTVESKLNEGTTFSFTLKTTSVSSSDKQAPDTTEATITDITNMNSEKTIIYIEDNPTNLKLVTQLLNRKQGVNLLSAMEPEKGLSLINQTIPDLILLDINLPGMNGYQLLERIKDNPSTSHIPVIAVSANAMTSDIEKGQHAGFSDYVTKPIDIQNFYSTLEQYLD